jgi:hypothetical protein
MTHSVFPSRGKISHAGVFLGSARDQTFNGIPRKLLFFKIDYDLEVKTKGKPAFLCD